MSKSLSESFLFMYFEAVRKILLSEYFLWLIAGFAVSARFFIAYARAPEFVYAAIVKGTFAFADGASSHFA